MTYLNFFGLILMILIMIPNIIYAIKYKGDFGKLPQTKFWKILEVFEQIGRYGCFACMIFNIPGTYFGFTSVNLFSTYLIVDFVLVFAYCIVWIFLPSFVFFFSGILSRSLLLTFSALIFAPCHIAISVKGCNIKK